MPGPMRPGAARCRAVPVRPHAAPCTGVSRWGPWALGATGLGGGRRPIHFHFDRLACLITDHPAAVMSYGLYVICSV
jgi:hypothetical protein